MMFLAVLFFSACEEDFTNPGAATEDQVLSSPDGVIGLAVGAQRRWSVGRQSPTYATVAGAGFTTNELRLINPGNQSENEVDLGYADLPGSNGIVTNIWEQCLLVRNETDKVIANVDIIPDANTRAWTLAYASIFNALANATIASFFEQTVLETEENAAFSSSIEGVRTAITTLEAANNAITSDDGGLLSRIPAGIDIPNTINALLARYYLLNGQYEEAISAAKAVDLAATSTLAYDAVATNPIAFVSILTNNVYQPIDPTLGLPAELAPDPADQRLPFYFEDINAANNDFRAAGFFDAPTDPIPIYLPGEMTLIAAEAHARQGRIGDAIAELDAVLTKSPADDAFGIGAGLDAYDGPATEEAVLEAIYANRCMEMMMSGQRLGDSKRFNRPDPNASNPERNRNWYPYPFSERDNNANTPDDPPI
ncbi:MAG: RagB/SusD family nutrient uptake outer membrane protein [Bacteroidota bacterium]